MTETRKAASTSAPAPDPPTAPLGINHLVINVRDLEESHRFWTEIVGFTQVGELKPSPERGFHAKMRFYSGINSEGRRNHHDLALVEDPALPPPPEKWAMTGNRMAINHIAVAFPDHESWLKRLRHVQSKGVKFERRVNHGMTRSLYIRDPNGYGVELIYELPREVWEGDIDAALNYIENLPTEGEAAVADDIESAPRFG